MLLTYVHANVPCLIELTISQPSFEFDSSKPVLIIAKCSLYDYQSLQVVHGGCFQSFAVRDRATANICVYALAHVLCGLLGRGKRRVRVKAFTGSWVGGQ